MVGRTILRGEGNQFNVERQEHLMNIGKAVGKEAEPSDGGWQELLRKSDSGRLDLLTTVGKNHQTIWRGEREDHLTRGRRTIWQGGEGGPSDMGGGGPSDKGEREDHLIGGGKTIWYGGGGGRARDSMWRGKGTLSDKGGRVWREEERPSDKCEETIWRGKAAPGEGSESSEERRKDDPTSEENTTTCRGREPTDRQRKDLVLKKTTTVFVWWKTAPWMTGTTYQGMPSAKRPEIASVEG